MISRRKFFGTAACGTALTLGPTGSQANLGSLFAPTLGSDRAGLERLAGQSLMVGLVGSQAGDHGSRALMDQLAAGLVGSVLLFGRNIETLRQTSELTGTLQEAAGRTLLVAIDNEGGAVTRTAGKPGFSDWLAADAVPGLVGGPGAVREYYRVRAGELRQAGINLNLAPVVDVNVNPASPAIGRLGRSFSSNPAVVAAFAQACVEGHHGAGVLTCIKHFPGHGSAGADTHDGIVDVTHTWTASELLPYTELVATNNVDALMLSHVIHAAFTGSDRTPVSLSPQAVHRVRAELGFTGPIVSDDLHMGAITRELSDEDAAVRALAAGNDLMIISNYETQDPELGSRINAAIVRAVVDGRLSRERLADASARIEAMKARV